MEKSWLIIILLVLLIPIAFAQSELSGEVTKDISGDVTAEISGKAASQNANIAIFVIGPPIITISLPLNATYTQNSSIPLNFSVGSTTADRISEYYR